jgi:hypothetical protein
MLNYFNHGLMDKAATLYKNHGVKVFSFPIFSVEFCTKFIAEINHFNKTSMPKGRPNSMNNYGVSVNFCLVKSFSFWIEKVKKNQLVTIIQVLLDELGFNERLLTPLRTKYLEPLTRFLFPHENIKAFDSHKAFTVDYEENKDTDLGFHFDNAEVKLSLRIKSNTKRANHLFANNCR